jgi:hypothetical protein
MQVTEEMGLGATRGLFSAIGWRDTVQGRVGVPAGGGVGAFRIFCT